MTVSRTQPWAAAAIVAGFVVACASPGIPPGGPPDSEIPQITRITPESGAVNVEARAVLVYFDEVIAERPTAAAGVGAVGAGVGDGLRGIVLLSPGDGREEIRWRRTAIEIRPRRPFRPNTAYRVTLLPGVADLRGNVRNARTEIVFSTGPEIPEGEVRGVLFDWATGTPAALAAVEVITPDDSTFRWIARADSSGRFVVRDLAPGAYRVRAWIDANSDRRLAEQEAFDSTSITLAERAEVELYAFVQDTMAPTLVGVDLLDSTALRLRFDRAVLGDWDPAGALTLFAADSSAVALAGVAMPSTRFDSLAQARTAAADSAARAATDTAAVADTSAVADTAAAPPAAPPPLTPQDSAAADTLAADSLAADSLAAPREPPPVFNRVRPAQQWSVPLAAPLAPGLYRLRVLGAPGLNRRSQETEREFRVQEPPPPAADTLAVPPDTVPTPPSAVPPTPARPRR